MLVYRIVHKKFSTGLSASGLEGRWNNVGKKVLYTSETIPLAFLENMVRRKGVGFNSDFKTLIIDIPDNVKIQIIKGSILENGWRDYKDYSKCKPIGDKWYNERKSMVLEVPSAILPDANNFIINRELTDFALIKVAGITELVPDPRIEEILKRYSKS
ncbi:RES family NAD+ phosphorylase [soil metagenome]